MKVKTSALALLVAVTLSGCVSHSAETKPATAPEKAPATQATNLQQRDLADGLYEMALAPKGDALYVASAEGFKDCLLYTSPSPRDATLSRMPSSA